MGIRGASGPVGCSDPSLQERVDRARLSRGAWARSGSPTLVSEILEAMARLEIHSPGTFVAANVSYAGNAGWYCHG